MGAPFDPARTSIAEQVIALVVTQLTTGRPPGVPALQRDRVLDLTVGPDATDLPAMLLLGYEERLPVAREAGVDTAPMDGSEERTLALHFGLLAQAGEGKTASQATDLMAAWIVAQLCGYGGTDSPFHGVADLIRPGPRTSQLAKAAMPYCLTTLEIQVATSFLTDDITRRG